MNKNSTLRGLMYTNFFSLSIKSFLWILSTSANFFQKNLTKNFAGKTSVIIKPIFLSKLRDLIYTNLSFFVIFFLDFIMKKGEIVCF